MYYMCLELLSYALGVDFLLLDRFFKINSHINVIV